MKKLLSIFILALGFIWNAQAQTAEGKTNPPAEAPAKQKTKFEQTTLKVKGNCSQCKERIESALDLDGIRKAQWDKNTGVLTVAYNTSKWDADKIAAKVQESGHDTEKGKAQDKTYDSLPDCCKYREPGAKPH